MWTQVVGKVRLALTPLVNHWWNVPLYVHRARVDDLADPVSASAPSKSVRFRPACAAAGASDRDRGFAAPRAAVGRRLLSRVHGDAAARGHRRVDLDDAGRDPRSHPLRGRHRPRQLRPRRRGALRPHPGHRRPRVQAFRAGFIGKCSPVHFFWGSFDLAVTRFSGRRAPERAGADAITREAYSHEVSSVGFWPGSGDVADAAFYAYTAPEPAGLCERRVRPDAAVYHRQLGEFLLMYDDVRNAASPSAALRAFCDSTYAAGADLGHWDRGALERPD